LWRPLIIPTAKEDTSKIPSIPQPSPKPAAVDAKPALCTIRSTLNGNYTWAQLMKRVFLVEFFNVNVVAAA
jgi:hypothetical protein